MVPTSTDTPQTPAQVIAAAKEGDNGAQVIHDYLRATGTGALKLAVFAACVTLAASLPTFAGAELAVQKAEEGNLNPHTLSKAKDGLRLLDARLEELEDEADAAEARDARIRRDAVEAGKAAGLQAAREALAAAGQTGPAVPAPAPVVTAPDVVATGPASAPEGDAPQAPATNDAPPPAPTPAKPQPARGKNKN